MHGISEAQWIEYVEGSLPAPDSARLRAHAATCAECSTALVELSLWREKLTEEADLLRAALALSRDHLDGLLAASIERIRQGHPRCTFREAVMLLRLQLEPFCGSGTAGAAVHLAVQRSTLNGAAENPAAWSLFVSNMSETMSAICGTEAGRLVNQVGVCLNVSQA